MIKRSCGTHLKGRGTERDRLATCISGIGTFRTSRDVRLGSGKRSEADVGPTIRIDAFTPWVRQNNPTGKFPLSTSGKSPLGLPPSCPRGRGVGHRHRTLGWDVVDAAASCARWDGRAGFCDPCAVPGRADERCRSVRQNRVVLTPQRLASSLAEVRKARPGRRASFREATEAGKPDTPGRARYKP
jgi:hypothetical protein